MLHMFPLTAAIKRKAGGNCSQTGAQSPFSYTFSENTSFAFIKGLSNVPSDNSIATTNLYTLTHLFTLMPKQSLRRTEQIFASYRN